MNKQVIQKNTTPHYSSRTTPRTSHKKISLCALWLSLCTLWLTSCSPKTTNIPDLKADELPISVEQKKRYTEDPKGYKVQIGDMVPDFSFTLTDGTQKNIRDLRGKPVMLQFTASWCGVCIKEMPHIESDIWQAYKDKGMQVIGIDRDEPLEKAQQLIDKTNITYPIALDPGAEIFGLFADKKAGVTRNVIIDHQGRIVYLTRLFNEAEFTNMKGVIGYLNGEPAPTTIARAAEKPKKEELKKVTEPTVTKTKVKAKEKTTEEEKVVEEVTSEETTSSAAKKAEEKVEKTTTTNGTKTKVKATPTGGLGKVPNFTLPTLDGSELTLYDTKAELILIDFWASWCAPCRKENRTTVVPLYAKYKEKGFEVIGISTDTGKESWVKAVEKDQATWPQVGDLLGNKSPIQAAYKVKSLPTTFLVDKEFNILAKNVHGEELEKFVEEYLSKLK